MIDSVQHKAQLRDYFDGAGFERWTAIYGQGELGRVRRSIRVGHDRMLKQAATWLSEAGIGPGMRVLDAGCGTGLWSVALAEQGCLVTAVDIAPKMVAATRARAEERRVVDRLTLLTGDLEQVRGSFDVVVCFDVLVHYPPPSFAALLSRLAACSAGPLLLTYAPRKPLLAALHWVGGHFPQGQRRTEIQMIPPQAVKTMLATAGMHVRHSTNINHGFYHVQLVEAYPDSIFS
ncbi:MAG: magnesium protoporphyrin IX methyltransferase [Herpetosiphonaceae bacterium]|nr:magnesium protoporphyrin IX methyltransferase [Herpetosiphonaceae bacterium]